jgi:hypothetical protein
MGNMDRKDSYDTAIIAKVEFFSSSLIEIRRFPIHNKDFDQFCDMVSDSLKHKNSTKEDLKFSYLDENEQWIDFSNDIEFTEAKRAFLLEDRSAMRIRVQVRDSSDIMQHCSFNLRSNDKPIFFDNSQSLDSIEMECFAFCLAQMPKIKEMLQGTWDYGVNSDRRLRCSKKQRKNNLIRKRKDKPCKNKSAISTEEQPQLSIQMDTSKIETDWTKQSVSTTLA